jgi:hypothetical protein
MVLFAPNNPDIITNVVQFLVHISASLQSVDENPLLDAALLTILSYVHGSWNPASVFTDLYRRLYSPFAPRRKHLPSYRACTVKLLSRIRASGLSAVIDEVHHNGDWVYFLQPLF